MASTAAQRTRRLALLGDRTSAHLGIGLAVAWCEPRPRAQPVGIGEAPHVTDLGDEHSGQHRAHPVDGLDGPVAGVVAQGLVQSMGAHAVSSMGHERGSVALRIEAPLYVPMPQTSAGLNKRAGERGRPWCAGAGTDALAMGAQQAGFVFAKVAAALTEPISASCPSSGYRVRVSPARERAHRLASHSVNMATGSTRRQPADKQ